MTIIGIGGTDEMMAIIAVSMLQVRSRLIGAAVHYKSLAAALALCQQLSIIGMH
jgi:precorrin-6B methylase 2